MNNDTLPTASISTSSLSVSLPADWFPFTKLRAPQRATDYVERAHLQAGLSAAVLRHKLTLIAAPAGAGKTNLAATLGQSHEDVVWVALHAADNDLATFVALLATALRGGLREDGQSILNFLGSVPGLEQKTAQLAALFINNLAANDLPPTILILDDYYAIDEPAIHRFVTDLLAYLPDSLRLVIATRHDPPLELARLRGQQQLAEIRLSDLAFTAPETAELLNEQRKLALTEAEIVALHRYTGGWIAGLQLVAAALETMGARDERAAYIAQLGPANRAIFELLAEQILGLQPPAIQEFLLQTSILPGLTSDNCFHVTENPAAAQLLAAVYARNLFLATLAADAYDGPFRYHDLFAQFLQQRLKQERPDQWRELHRRAAEVAASAEQKLSHWMAAECWNEAASLLERMGQMDTERRVMRRVVADSIQALPEPVQQEHPWLLLFVGQYYAVHGYIERARPWLAQAATRFREEGDEVGEIEILTAQAIGDAGGDDDTVLAFRQKIATSRHLIRPDQWAIYHGSEIWYAVEVQDWVTLTEHYQALVDHAIQSNDPGALTMASMIVGPQTLFNDRGMADAEKLARYCLSVAGTDDWVLRACAQSILGFTHFLRGRLHAAERAALKAHELLETVGGLVWVEDHVVWLRLCLALARRAYGAFDELLAAQAHRQATQDSVTYYRFGYLYMQGRALWLRNRIVEAKAVLARMQTDSGPTAYGEDDEVRRLLLAGLVAMSTGDLGAATRDLRAAKELHQRTRHTMMITHPGLALATLLGRQNRWDEALDELRSVVKELKSRGTPGVILQEGESIAPLLARAVDRGIAHEMLQPLLEILQPRDTSQAIALPHSNEYLTGREGEVLALLATGATNAAIAGELSITERTVKAHVTRILAKLDATTRTEAVARATRLGLL